MALKRARQFESSARYEVGFQKELKASKADILAAQDSTAAEATFLFANTTSALAKVTTFAKKLKSAEALWIVYPKGQEGNYREPGHQRRAESRIEGCKSGWIFGDAYGFEIRAATGESADSSYSFEWCYDQSRFQLCRERS